MALGVAGESAEMRCSATDAIRNCKSPLCSWMDMWSLTTDALVAPVRSGDSTFHLLHRLQEGEMSGAKPKLVVLNIGTNDLSTYWDRETIKVGDALGEVSDGEEKG